MKLQIGITTYNRMDYLLKSSNSLFEVNGIKECDLRIYDDFSREFGLDEIKRVYSMASKVIRREKNLGSDENLRQMYIDFLESDNDYLLNADSDLIFSPDMLDFLKKVIEKSDGILSLYNSSTHPYYKEELVENYEFLLKDHVGSAGVVFSKPLLKEIIENVPSSRKFDWDWSKYLKSKNKRILVSKQSYIQHIGFHGYNTDILAPIDFGLNFYPVNEVNQKILVDFFQDALLAKDKGIKLVEKSITDKLSYKIYRGLIFPFRFVKTSINAMKKKRQKR